MDLNNIDLRLLRVFNALMLDKNTTKAGKRIGLSQSAVLHALSNLRIYLKDELFVHVSGGLKPTPRAIELIGPVRKALNILSAALDPPIFDPAKGHYQITLLTNEYASFVFLPRIVKHLRTIAPGIDLHVSPVTNQDFAILDHGQADFAMSDYLTIPDRFMHVDIYKDSYVLLVPANHSLATGDISLEAYADADHVIMSSTGDPRGFVDDQLAEQGLKRRVAVVVNQFSIIPKLLESGDMVASVPLAVVDTLNPGEQLVVRPSPLHETKAHSALSMIWHKRLAISPAQKWFATCMHDLFSEIEPQKY